MALRLSRLQKSVLAGSFIQLAITLGLPVAQFLVLFDASPAALPVLLVSGLGAALAGGTGIASALSHATCVHWPALHVVTAITLAALLGGFSTQLWADLSARCAAPGGLGSGLAALVPAEACARAGSWHALLLPYTGLLQALCLAAPAVGSLQLLVRAAALQPLPAVVLDLEAPPSERGGRALLKAWHGITSDSGEEWPSTTLEPHRPPQPPPSPHELALKQQAQLQQQGRASSSSSGRHSGKLGGHWSIGAPRLGDRP